MKAVILYRPVSDHARPVDEYVREFKIRTGRELELVSTETKDGAKLAELYGIVQYPALIVTNEDGHYLKHWEGLPLPLFDEVQGYLAR
ncbi:MAG: hypothetical protein M3P98_01405 [bacterium]|nr:hypothetical protein [bacterium]